MGKRRLDPTERYDLRQALQVEILHALMKTRRWKPGDLIFQGGTSLHLVHGSPRLSEDLDFLVSGSLKQEFDSIAASMKTRFGKPNWMDGLSLTVSKERDGHNPHSFMATVGSPDLIGSVRVRVEMFQAEDAALDAMKVIVAPVGTERGKEPKIFVPTAELQEIYADKVFSLAARPYLKSKDVFDLYWLNQQNGVKRCSTDDLNVRLATYPSVTPRNWLDKADARLGELPTAGNKITMELGKCLPSSWPLTESNVQQMIQSASQALRQGIEIMLEIEEIECRVESDESDDSPAP